jgi:hypothetical protein
MTVVPPNLDNTLNYATVASYHVLSVLLFIIHRSLYHSTIFILIY